MTTDAFGIATANLLTANAIAGNYQVSASVGNINNPVLFNLTNTPESLPSPPAPIPTRTARRSGASDIDSLDIPVRRDNPVELPERSRLNIDLPTDKESTILTVEPSVPELEEHFVPTFENYFGLGETAISSLEEARQVLNEIEGATGVKPALIYAFFVPATAPTPSSELSVEKNFTPHKSDRLKLVVVTAAGQLLHYKVDATREQVLQEVWNLQSLVTNTNRRRAYLAPAKQLYRWLVVVASNKKPPNQQSSSFPARINCNSTSS